MRKLLVKHFVLDYFNIFGLPLKAVRASRIIFPLFVLTGILLILHDQCNLPYFFVIVAYLFDALSIYFGFVYFRIWPAQWEELDDEQKWQYGVLKELTEAQYKEWAVINKRLNHE